MVNHICSPHYLTFFEEDDQALSHPHNLALHVEVQIFHTCICWVLIDNGAGLNIILFNVINKIEPIEYLCTMNSKYDNQPNYDAEDERPKVVLKMWNALQHHNKAITKVVFWVAESSSS